MGQVIANASMSLDGSHRERGQHDRSTVRLVAERQVP